MIPDMRYGCLAQSPMVLLCPVGLMTKCPEQTISIRAHFVLHEADAFQAGAQALLARFDLTYAFHLGSTSGCTGLAGVRTTSRVECGRGSAGGLPRWSATINVHLFCTDAPRLQCQ